VRPGKLDYFAPGPRRSASQIAEFFSETATTGGRMVSKRKQRPCDDVSEDMWRRICRNPNMRAKKPCEGPLPETSEAEPSRSCRSPISESTSAVTTGSGRIVIEPIRLAEDDDYVEQLGRLRDQRDQPWKAPDHVTKDAQIEALTAEVAELHEQSIKVHGALRTAMATHTRQMKGKETTSKRSMASSSLPRRAWRSCATRRLVVPNRRGRRRA
jgi:hypothetical protein